MDQTQKFQEEVRQSIQGLANDRDMKDLSRIWLRDTLKHRYSYNFSWLGRPIIQYPQDMVAMQEIIWKVRPSLIIETGIAHGGSLILSASLLAMLDYCDAVAKGTSIDPLKPNRTVLGIDVDIRQHNRSAIEAHPLASRIQMIEGSSTSPSVIEMVREAVSDQSGAVLVFLDSNHTHEHVLAELEAYAPLTSVGSYCCVFDTVVEDIPDNPGANRPWGKGNNPKTAVWEFLERLKSTPQRASSGSRLAFEIDRSIEHKLLLTVAPDGYLKRVS